MSEHATLVEAQEATIGGKMASRLEPDASAGEDKTHLEETTIENEEITKNDPNRRQLVKLALIGTKNGRRASAAIARQQVEIVNKVKYNVAALRYRGRGQAMLLRLNGGPKPGNKAFLRLLNKTIEIDNLMRDYEGTQKSGEMITLLDKFLMHTQTLIGTSELDRSRVDTSRFFELYEYYGKDMTDHSNLIRDSNWPWFS